MDVSLQYDDDYSGLKGEYTSADLKDKETLEEIEERRLTTSLGTDEDTEDHDIDERRPVPSSHNIAVAMSPEAREQKQREEEQRQLEEQARQRDVGNLSTRPTMARIPVTTYLTPQSLITRRLIFYERENHLLRNIQKFARQVRC